MSRGTGADGFTSFGRAEGEEAKRAVAERLLRLWLDRPYLRLGQLIGNIVRDERTLYAIEDQPLIDALEAGYTH